MEVNFVVAFFSGIVSFFAPCVVPLLPAYVGYVTGVSIKDLKEKGASHYRKQMLFSSILYIFGFSLVFVLLGTTAASFGTVLRSYNDWIQIIGGLFIMFFALSFMGVLTVSFFETEHKMKLPAWVDNLGYFRAFFVGMVFATAWTPCVGAVLGAILTLAATSTNAAMGASLLFVYSLGISIPFLIISLSIAQAPALLRGITRYLPVVQKVAGAVLFIIGFLLFNNNLKQISPLLTYNQLNGFLFSIAGRFGLEQGLVEVFGI